MVAAKLSGDRIAEASEAKGHAFGKSVQEWKKYRCRHEHTQNPPHLGMEAQKRSFWRRPFFLFG